MTDRPGSRPSRARAPSAAPPARSGAKRWIFRSLAALVGLVAGCVVAELALRFYDPPSMRGKRLLVRVGQDEPGPEYLCYSSDPNGELGARPNTAAGSWQLLEFSLPPRQLPLSRLPETPYCVAAPPRLVEPAVLEGVAGTHLPRLPPPAPGRMRILGLGDSFAAGEGVPAAKRLFAQMERLLGERYQIVNAAVSGFDIVRERQTLRALAPISGATRALVVWIANDIPLTPELQREQRWVNDLVNIREAELARHQSGAWYHGHSRLLALLGAWLDMRRIEQSTIAWYRRMYQPSHNGENLARFRSELEAIAKTPGLQVAFVMYPLMLGFDDEYPLRGVHRKVEKMARAAGLPVLDLTPAFMGKKPEALRVHPADHHPNGRAHAIAARAIVGWLESDLRGFIELSAPFP